jgi:hypothetical protein
MDWSGSLAIRATKPGTENLDAGGVVCTYVAPFVAEDLRNDSSSAAASACLRVDYGLKIQLRRTASRVSSEPGYPGGGHQGPTPPPPPPLPTAAP